MARGIRRRLSPAGNSLGAQMGWGLELHGLELLLRVFLVEGFCDKSRESPIHGLRPAICGLRPTHGGAMVSTGVLNREKQAELRGLVKHRSL